MVFETSVSLTNMDFLDFKTWRLLLFTLLTFRDSTSHKKRPSISAQDNKNKTILSTFRVFGSSWKEPFYYINRLILNFNRTWLYLYLGNLGSFEQIHFFIGSVIFIHSICPFWTIIIVLKQEKIRNSLKTFLLLSDHCTTFNALKNVR